MMLFRKNDKAKDLYRKVWKRKNSNEECKDEDAKLSSIRPFKISVLDSVLDDLKSRLETTRFSASSTNSNFNNGLSTVHLKKFIDYWKTEFDWRKQEQELNKCPQFKTRIENIDIHFLHFKVNQRHDTKVKLIPLLLIHNWPGSFADFHKVIPILQASCLNQEFVFEIVCPSLPGCGFSEAPLQTDFQAINLSQILLALMDRLGYKEFYVHGYGWGALTASLMARYYPYNVKGMHVNMCFALPNLLDSFIKTLVVSICPIFINSAEHDILFPLKKKLRTLLQETGFLHMQCTKPDTLGCAVTDSPTALAIHVLEKFLFKKNSHHSQPQEGDLKGKFFDDLLTLITIIWVSDHFGNGARFLKESISAVLQRKHENGLPLTVPCGIAFFPDEIFMLPKYMMENMVEDLASYTIMPRGGHFAALEEPQMHPIVLVDVELTINSTPLDIYAQTEIYSAVLKSSYNAA
ncbi:Epoxide hydrolase 1 like protein [Argiope bruennichi]|uniref:Epoxide hydrolase n=1 Tax=Argiope bruennichi TaxID=94029 RepID=A0A8T0FA01_ARGBR|nr:Epoxide hydrolase 1 like protein [Argiope bruennichi]